MQVLVHNYFIVYKDDVSPNTSSEPVFQILLFFHFSSFKDMMGSFIEGSYKIRFTENIDLSIHDHVSYNNHDKINW